MIIIKNDKQIQAMRDAGKITAEVHAEVANFVREGVSTLDISNFANKQIKKRGAVSSFYQYNGFPGFICVSLNDEVVHGIPSAKRIVKNGDLVSVDIGAFYKGFHGDMARTYMVGVPSDEQDRLLKATRDAFYAGMNAAVQGNRVIDISTAVESVALENKLGVVIDYVGHGVGQDLHEDPEIPNFVPNKKGPRLYNGMTLAIEPMFTLGAEETDVLDNEWTAVTVDGSLSAHYENTILITDNGPEILTKV